MAGTLFTDVRILDCTGAEPYLGEVLVEAACIVAVVREPQRLSREGVNVIDGHGATLMPGLIESHAHLSIDDAADLVQIGMIPPEETTLIAVRNARLYLDCGITSCISAASAKPRTDIVIRNAINKGEIPGPRQLRRRGSDRSARSKQGLGVRESQHRLHGDGVVCRGEVVHRGASPGVRFP